MVSLRDRLSECSSFQAITGTSTASDALKYIHLGIGPVPWDQQEFSEEELANRFVIAVIRPDDEDSQTVVEDARAVETDPGQETRALVLVRRYVRDVEINEDGTGQDIHNYLWDHFSNLAKQLYTVSNTISDTNQARCPRVRQVNRLGMSFPPFGQQVTQGGAFIADYQVTMGSIED